MITTNPIKKRRGRPKNLTKDLDLLTQRKIALQSYLNGAALTLDETRLAIWDPTKEEKPVTKKCIQLIERRALAKLKLAAEKKFGIKNLADLLPSDNPSDHVMMEPV